MRARKENCDFILGDESVPGQYEPVGVDQAEPAEKGEEDGSSKPILGEEWQRPKPVLDVCSSSSGHCYQIRMFLER